MERPVVFEHVSKVYPLYNTSVGIKHFLTHLPTHLREARRRKFWALRDISFSVERGEAFGIMGKNGAGKSTILGLIAGVLRPTHGTIRVQGRIAPLLELGAGFHPELTGRENILLNGVLLGMTRREVLARMDEIIAFSELGAFIDQPIRTYSSGMFARLGFSVAVHVDPEILLIDEILAVGDVPFQQKCLKKMLTFKKNGVSIVYVSHSLQLVSVLCDRMAFVEEGRIKEIRKKGEF